jgi:hypothetical protein
MQALATFHLRHDRSLPLKKRPRCGAGPGKRYRLISTSTPGRRSLLISTSGSLTRRRSSTVTSGSRTVLPTVTSGVRVQFSPQSGPTQFRSHTSAALAGSERRVEPVNAAATAKARAVRISNLHEFFNAGQRAGDDGVPRFQVLHGCMWPRVKDRRSHDQVKAGRARHARSLPLQNRMICKEVGAAKESSHWATHLAFRSHGAAYRKVPSDQRPGARCCEVRVQHRHRQWRPNRKSGTGRAALRCKFEVSTYVTDG